MRIQERAVLSEAHPETTAREHDRVLSQLRRATGSAVSGARQRKRDEEVKRFVYRKPEELLRAEVARLTAARA